MSWLIKIFGRATAPMLAWAAIGIAAFIGALVAGLVVQTKRLDTAHEKLGETRTELQLCRALNTETQDQIDEINAQAHRNIERAEALRLAARRAAQDMARQIQQRDEEFEQIQSDLRRAMAGDDCADQLVPADVDRLFRAGSPDPDGDGHPHRH